MEEILFQVKKDLGQRWRDTVRRGKRQHWREFLQEAKEQAMWRALRMYGGSRAPSAIPPLKDPDGNPISTTAGKASLFDTTFFPPLPPLEFGGEAANDVDGDDNNVNHITFEPLSRQEARRAMFRQSPNKAPGPDGIPFLVLQQVWSTISEHVFQIYDASLRLSYFPSAWKEAMIVVIRKPKKADYTIPEAYRPISLLATLGKGLESTVAERIKWYAEEFNLLPQNHMGG